MRRPVLATQRERRHAVFPKIHPELRLAFAELAGQLVAVGRNPFDYDDQWVYRAPDEVMVLKLRRKGSGYVAA